MFEITRDDIAALNDEDLRTLIGRLCEATLRRANLPVSAVTWGGDQNAKDGGLDVRVELPLGTKIDGFIPRAATGFQVKKPDMPASEIPKEMKPKGVVRPVIEELATAIGAYIIVSSSGSTADFALKSRLAAMAKAVDGIADSAKLCLDFYDRNRVATWVRDHPGLITWVRSRIGKSVPGWRPYGDWSYIPAGADKTYLLDDKARIKTGAKDDGDGLSAVDGINRIRDALRNPGQVVRLVGLSGVGKTRLVEALFDNAVGANALDPSLAIYTDTADEPNPPPKGLACDLVAAETRAILIIDNCSPETHRPLADVVRALGSTISLITIEYDIRDDQPEGTDVFTLETSSLPLIEKLVAARFPELSQVDVRTVAKFSGGNARIAFALAGTVKNAGTVAGLSDTALFKRLFQQRHERDAGLQQVAEVCSLVYSFQGEALAGDEAELPILGGLIGKNAQEVGAAAVELKRRDLLQQRRQWRAVLPHAIANRLAALALQNVPYSIIEAAIVNEPSERLLRSFSRRLGYLDGSKEAQAIVRSWLASNGLLSDVLNLNDLGRTIFGNVAPVLPEATLSALENVFANADREALLRGGHFVRLLHALAYDTPLFERAVKLLCRFASVLDEKDFDGEATRAVASLFFIALSGTHAPLPMRLRVLEALLKSEFPVEQHCGVKALEAMMTSDHFTSFSGFEFGARSRDYGYHAKNGKEVGIWFEEVLKAAEPFALHGSAVTAHVRRVISQKFRGLWVNGNQVDTLERISKAIAGNDFWRDGWIAARQTRRYEGKTLGKESLRRLTVLEEFLRPKDLVNRVRGTVLGERGRGRFLDDIEDVENVNYEEQFKRAGLAAEELGKDVAADKEAFATLLPDLINSSGRLGEFGRGLAAGAEESGVAWRALSAKVASTKRPNVQVLCGFLDGLQPRSAAEVHAILDEALDDPLLGEWLVELQASVEIDDMGIGRLHRALELGRASVDHFQTLTYRRVCEPIPGPAFRDLVLAIGTKPEGNRIAVDIVSMRLHSDATAKRTPLPETVEAGRTLLSQYQIGQGPRGSAHDEFALSVVANACLGGPKGEPVARKMWRDLKAAIAKFEVSAWDQDDFLQALFKTQPVTMLDEFVAGSENDRKKSAEIIQRIAQHHDNPVGAVADSVLLAWCDIDPELRYPFAAAVAQLFTHRDEKAAFEWRPIARTLLERAPDSVAVFKAINQRIWPTDNGVSLATLYEVELQLIDRLEIGTNPLLVAAFNETRARRVAALERQRRTELEEGRAESGRFE